MWERELGKEFRPAHRAELAAVVRCSSVELCRLSVVVVVVMLFVMVGCSLAQGGRENTCESSSSKLGWLEELGRERVRRSRLWSLEPSPVERRTRFVVGEIPAAGAGQAAASSRTSV